MSSWADTVRVFLYAPKEDKVYANSVRPHRLGEIMIHIEREGAVSVLRIEHGNVQAMDLDLMTAFSETLDELRSLRPGAVILTGTGSTFSAGVDLPRLLEGGTDYVKKFVPALCSAVQKLFAFPRPVIAAVNGHAIAGGCILVCASDYRIMAEGAARLGVPELLVGVAFPPIVLEVLRFALPNQRLQELVYLGQTYAAAKALSLGLVDEIVKAESMLDRAKQVADRFASAPMPAFESCKRQLRQPFIERATRFEAEDSARILEQWCSPETHAIIRAYIEKTLRKK
jgi:enoyl-CoA hydratase